MKIKIVGVLFLLLISTIVVPAININIKEPTQKQTFETILYCNKRNINNQPILLNWGLDQEQTDNCGQGIILSPPWLYAQSFIPTEDKMTAVRLFIFKYGTPPEPIQITVSIRDNLTYSDLTSKTIDTRVVTIGNKAIWVLFDFKDISVTPGRKYFIVCSGNAGDDTNAYCWFYNNEDTYSGGKAWIKPDEVSIWTTLPHYGFNPDDFCFKTYFLKPLGGWVSKNNKITMPISHNILSLLL